MRAGGRADPREAAGLLGKRCPRASPARSSTCRPTIPSRSAPCSTRTPRRSRRSSLRGKIVVSEGFAFPQKIREFEELGAIGVIAVNPGVDIHWGICTSIWGTPDLDDLPRKPSIPVAAVNNPDGRELIALAGSGEQVTLATRLEEGWYRQKLPVVEIQGGERAREVRAPARPLRFLGRRRRRQRDRRRDAARDRARAARSHRKRAAALGADRLVAGPLDRPLRRLDLVRRHLRDRPRRELRRADQLRLPGLPLGDACSRTCPG